MVFHALVEHFLGGIAIQHPATDLRVPHQAVSAQFDAVGTAEIGDTVSIVPVELTLLGLSGLWFHVILAGDAAEFLLDQRLLFRIGHIALIDSHADEEIILVGVFKALRPTGNTTSQEEQTYKKLSFHNEYR